MIHIHDITMEEKLKLKTRGWRHPLLEFLELVGCLGFTRKLIKLKWTHESIPTAWGWSLGFRTGNFLTRFPVLIKGWSVLIPFIFNLSYSDLFLNFWLRMTLNKHDKNFFLKFRLKIPVVVQKALCDKKRCSQFSDTVYHKIHVLA